MSARTPIEARLAQLYSQWDTFIADPDARVLRWLLRDDERRMFEAFLAIEDDDEGELSALFFAFNEPFVGGGYGHELRLNLDRQLQAMSPELEAMGLQPWVAAGAESTVTDIGALMHTCAAVVRHLGEIVEALAPRAASPGLVAGRDRRSAGLRRVAAPRRLGRASGRPGRRDRPSRGPTPRDARP
ncbi:hypothetical protein [Enhygromyxa salina]|uniref:hypothetical protein n=1 Tax=Enhygromyxa salina TaxID=215803 RepID=UPI000D08ED9B|nr:hypothetical protein [Enhygromyxa salina]